MAHDAPNFDGIAADPATVVGIVRSVWHGTLTQAMVDSAVATLTRAGIPRAQIIIVDAPGSFELPLLAQALIDRKNVHAVIACGIVIDGATHHADLIAQSATDGLMRLQMERGIPIAHALLHVRTLDDARSRALGEHSRGMEAAHAILHALAQIGNLQRGIS